MLFGLLVSCYPRHTLKPTTYLGLLARTVKPQGVLFLHSSPKFALLHLSASVCLGLEVESFDVFKQKIMSLITLHICVFEIKLAVTVSKTKRVWLCFI